MRGAAPAFVALLAFGCASQPPPPADSAQVPAATGVDLYLPLVDGTVFSYDTRSEPAGERGLLVLEVRRPRSDSAELVVAGRAQRLRVSAAGVELVSGGYLLKPPLERGAEFTGDFGRVTITQMDATVRVPAGTLGGCLETLETSAAGATSRVTTTVFCPGVGIAARRTEAETEAGLVTESLELRSHGKKFVLPP